MYNNTIFGQEVTWRVGSVPTFGFRSICREFESSVGHFHLPPPPAPPSPMPPRSIYKANTRREEVVLARIRLGHTYLTHSSLLNREDQPECVGFTCPLTVQHIMIGCVEFAYIRSRFFDVRNMNMMKYLFDSVTPSTILLYVRAIGHFFKM